MTRRCSHCSHNGHNSRTCPDRISGGGGGSGGVKLFGVRLIDGSIMKKSASMGNLSSLHHHASASPPLSGSPASDKAKFSDGCLSDDPTHASSSTNLQPEKKKGVPWSEEEHRLFLLGLQKLGKGDWRGISKSYVTSRTPTQVASHAQKHFIRLSHVNRRKRRSSLFDMASDESKAVTEETLNLPYQIIGGYDKEKTGQAKGISLDLSLKSDSESMEIKNVGPQVCRCPCPLNYMSLQLQLRPPNVQTVNARDLVGMSQLNLGHREPSPLSLRLN